MPSDEVAQEILRFTDALVAMERVRLDMTQRVPHALRRPLVVIRGEADLLLCGAYGDVAPQLRAAVLRIAARAEELTVLIDRLMVDVAAAVGDEVS